MDYIIKDRRDNRGILYRLDIDFIPEDLVLSSFFAQIRLENYPDFINAISGSSSSGYEYISLRMFSDIDWEDQSWVKSVMGRELKKGDIFLHHEYIGDTIIVESIFDKILYDFSLEILNTYRENDNVQKDYVRSYNQNNNNDKPLNEDPSWVKAMTHALSKLSQKMMLKK